MGEWWGVGVGAIFFLKFYDLKSQIMPNLKNAIFDETLPLRGTGKMRGGDFFKVISWPKVSKYTKI